MKCECYRCALLVMDALDDDTAATGWTPPCLNCLWLTPDFLEPEYRGNYEFTYSCALSYFECAEKDSIQEIFTERLKMETCPNYRPRKRTKTRKPAGESRREKELRAACAYLQTGSIRAAAKQAGVSRQLVRRAIKQQESNADMG